MKRSREGARGSAISIRFGDFDLLLGGARLSLKIVDLPVRYGSRSYGSTNISRVRHGLLLARMSLIGFLTLKARPNVLR